MFVQKGVFVTDCSICLFSEYRYFVERTDNYYFATHHTRCCASNCLHTSKDMKPINGVVMIKTHTHTIERFG